MAFTLDEIERYSRQMTLPEWGAEGQERVQAATIRILGNGPAARTAALYLTSAGSKIPHPDPLPQGEGDRAIQIDLAAKGRIVGMEDREAVGAACAVEAL